MTSNNVVSLIGDLAWPITVVVVFVVLRVQIRSVVEKIGTSIANRVERPETTLSAGPTGFQLATDVEVLKNRTNALDARTDAISTTQDQHGQLIVGQLQEHEPPVKELGIPDELREMAKRYRHTHLRDERQNIDALVRVANEMGFLIVSRRISRDALAEDGDEGLAVGLAAAVTLDPKPRDPEILLRAGQNARRRNARYRILVAFTRLHEAAMLRPDQVDAAMMLIDHYRDDADQRLLERISSTEALLRGGANA
jgi:hypothetical protein